MQYDVEVGGRIRQVGVVRAGDAFAVTVDGRVRQVDVARIDAHTLSLVVDTVWLKDITVSAESSSAGASSAGAGPGRFTVLVGTTPVSVTIGARGRAGRRPEPHVGGATAQAGAGPLGVTAPMPGKVVRLLVQVGDTVAGRQPVAVVEAMKMENELRAPRAGRVAEIHTREGASVEAGTLLIVIQ